MKYEQLENYVNFSFWRISRGDSNVETNLKLKYLVNTHLYRKRTQVRCIKHTVVFNLTFYAFSLFPKIPRATLRLLAVHTCRVDRTINSTSLFEYLIMYKWFYLHWIPIILTFLHIQHYVLTLVVLIHFVSNVINSSLSFSNKNLVLTKQRTQSYQIIHKNKNVG